MNELTSKILASGLVDEAMAKIMEHWGYLPEGMSELVHKAELTNATREQLIAFAEKVGDEVDKARRLKETMLDLNQLRWPVETTVYDEKLGEVFTDAKSALIDRMGRYYFRPQDITTAQLVPGRRLFRKGGPLDGETILEVTELFVDDQVAAIQVSVQ